VGGIYHGETYQGETKLEKRKKKEGRNFNVRILRLRRSKKPKHLTRGFRGGGAQKV